METLSALHIFSALSNEGRLAVFRLLLRHAPSGVTAGEIARGLGLKANTLSVHLAHLDAAGLVRAERMGRFIRYRSDLAQTAELVTYLFADCGRARPDLAPITKDVAMSEPFKVLFLCSGNSARSIFAEALLRDLGGARFAAYSAGTRPQSGLNPFAIEVLERGGHSTAGLRSKPVTEFQTPDAPQLDFVFTVCDAAASEDCAPWPGQPITAHWGLPDPVKATGTDAEKSLAFAQSYAELRRRIIAFAALPMTELTKVALQTRVDHIGQA